jgi:glycosyltransferase involved in cell wall biosynthesis
MDTVDLSVVIACYNEETVLEQSMREIFQVLDATRYTYEIIFVDDCSKDNTRKIIDELIGKYSDRLTDLKPTEHPVPIIKKIFHLENQGRGQTVADGIREAQGKIVGFIDIDLEAHARYIPSMVMAIHNGADIAIGWRIYKLQLRTLHRAISSKTYITLVNWLLQIPLKDTETGYKFFNREKILPILEEVEDKRWFWDTEIMTRAYYKQFKIAEIPVLFIKRYEVPSTVKFFKDSREYFVKLLKFRKIVKTLKRETFYEF